MKLPVQYCHDCNAILDPDGHCESCDHPEEPPYMLRDDDEEFENSWAQYQ